MGHERRGNHHIARPGRLLAPPVQPGVEEGVPIAPDEPAAGVGPEFAHGATSGIAIDQHHFGGGQGAACLGAFELAGVKGPVTPAADDHDAADRPGTRRSRDRPGHAQGTG